jgi:hypothetical protein
MAVSGVVGSTRKNEFKFKFKYEIEFGQDLK